MILSFRSSTASFCFFLLLAVASVACLGQTASAPVKSASDDPAYRDANEFYDQGKFVDAMPIFEKLAAAYPSDPAVREGWAWCLMEYSATLPDPEQRKKVRVRARMVALQAKQLGDNSQLLQVVLEIPEDGAEPAFSNRKEIDDAMKAAEADFARGELDKARQGYLKALLIDPNYYEAALFIGDVYFKQNVPGGAGEWFARAVAIDPNRETAFRYWGDSLSEMGKNEEARAKFIEAIVAEPYNRSSWMGLTNWLNRNKLELNKVALKEGAAVTQKDDKNISITIDDNGFKKKNDPNGLAWMTYGLTRASWRGDRFKKEFPAEPKYRRTLKEEAECLDIMISVLKEQKDYQKKLKDLDPSLQSLIKIQEAGLLEPFVLLNRADTEIAQDYEPYRNANRDKIRRYVDEFMVPKAPATPN